MDVVYVVRAGSNTELRYSLRSLTNLPHDQVWIVGHAPAWVTGVRVLPTVQAGTKAENVRLNWSRFVAHPDAPDEFVVMNDDFMVTRAVTELPLWHAGTLVEHAARVREGSWYHVALERTLTLLQKLGYDEPRSYELHVPMAVAKAGWAEAIGHKRDDSRVAPRSIYGARAGLGGVQHRDVKVTDLAAPVPAGPFCSTSEQTFARSRVGTAIRAAFPEPCRYERAR